MTTHACHWAGSDQPRMMTGRHLDGCAPDHCRGCQPCNVPLCRVCGTNHVDGTDTCPGCVGEVRDNLAEILRMCDDLPAEVEHRGVDSEAFVLLGPVADPEAWGHRQASAAVGRIDRSWLEQSDDAHHPLAVLATWEDVWRDALEHHTEERATVEGAAEYLGRQLTYMAGYEHVPFEDFARDLRQCVGHLEAVLHDGEQVERTRVTCNADTCRKKPRLERHYGRDEKADAWVCPSCKHRYDAADYRDAHARQLRHASAERYVRQVEAVSTLATQGRSERTIRAWMSAAEVSVARYCDPRTHEVYVWWPDLWRLHLTTPTRNRTAA